MRKLNLLAICSLIVVLMACTKEDTPALPDGSISFDHAIGSDVIENVNFDIKNERTITFEMKAALKGTPATADHYITFSVDTTKITEYRAKYSDPTALVLPTSVYLFYKPIVKLPAGATTSEAAELNMAQQKKLDGYTTYVLPILIKSVDGKTDGPATNRVIYYVFKTGQASVINKNGWTITAFSSQNSATNAPTALIDANTTTTFWASNITQTMPQFVTISFGKEIKFTGISYAVPTALNYPTLGGYPTSFKIETSMDGTNWVNKGTFTGNINTTTKAQIIDFNPTVVSAKFLRFTALAAVKYSNLYDAVFISDISLLP